MASSKNMARTAYLQKLEKALDLKPFMSEAEKLLNRVYDSDDDTDSENEFQQKRPTYEEKEMMYKSGNIDDERKWLYNVLLSDTESESEISDEDRYVAEMLTDYVQEKKIREKYHQNPNVRNLINI
jgi:DNA helicase INO80